MLPLGADQQVHVVGHQHVGMQGNTLSGKRLAQQRAVAVEVLGIEENRGPVHAPMRHMHRDSGQFETWSTRHGIDSLIRRPQDALPKQPLLCDIATARRAKFPRFKR